MTFAQAIRTCLRKYFTFSGRATRPEYWYFVLFAVVGTIGATIVESIFGFSPVNQGPDGAAYIGTGAGPLSGLFNLALVIPLLSVGWRRMHDAGRSGLYLIYPIIAGSGAFSFAAMIGAQEALAAGNTDLAFSGVTGTILLIAFIITALSPFLVIWWLTRPTLIGSNKWGPQPNPNEVSS